MLKPLNEQVVVILGGSSGIGRASALALAGRGAKLVVAARSESDLASLSREIKANGGEATYAVCDVSDFAQVQAVASLAVKTFGGIDTWVNAAAVTVFASFEDTTPEEFRRVMEVNYLGQVHGALAALPHLRRRGQGAIIAISSVEGIVALPMHAAYTASKHAVEGAMDSLRRDLMAEQVPISITSIKPATINTPLFTNARNKFSVKPKGPRPIYQPKIVAQCVEYAAEHPIRDLYAGGFGRLMVINQYLGPKMMDRYMSTVVVRQERRKEPSPGLTEGNLMEPISDDRVEGDWGRRGRGFSSYTWLQLHPRAKRALTVAVVTRHVARRAVRRAKAARVRGLNVHR
jgi:NAD(P)-dependent dehydrogenase (short-subunit alcohol dehydrogenase family)